MEIKQRGNVLGHKIILYMYKIFGYNFIAFILNFVALYYVLFTPSVKKSLQSYYEHQGIKLTNRVYFSHIKSFAFSIFDRFVSRINPEELSFTEENTEVIDKLQDGGIILLSHIGSWTSAVNTMKKRFPLLNIVMKESTNRDIVDLEKNKDTQNSSLMKIIDLNQGAIAANVQIANALMSKELVGLMADRVVDHKQVVEVEFFGSKVLINKNPFSIAKRIDKPLVAFFVTRTGMKKYVHSINYIQNASIEDMAQAYASLLEGIIRKYPNQWYNFYNFFQREKV